MATRIIVVVWTALCLMAGMLAGAWIAGPRTIQVEPSASSVKPVTRLYPILISP
jgi:hypothetical protein